jgi:ubiquinone/menaquinone biosynthesis C-methylase UbiE
MGGWREKMSTNLSVKISIRNREKKYKLFMRLLNPNANDKILDVGYENESVPDDYLNYLEKKYPYLNNITALGIRDYDSIQVYNNDLARGGNEFRTVKYDGKIFPFSDKSFDIGYCNAVIEHVGNRDAQILFFKEICRVCKKVFLTTPNKFFPIETHTKYPFIHMLPDKLFLKILSKTKKKGWVTNLYLLSERSIKEILNASDLKGKYCIIKQRFLVFTMTFSVIIFAGR